MKHTGRIKRGPIAADIIGRNFTQVFNKAVRDRRLSRRARGLLVELLSHRDGYGISIPALVAAGPEGRDAIRSALAELEKYGYLHRSQERDPETGQLGEAVYEVTDMPEGLVLEAPAPWTDEGAGLPNEPAEDESSSSAPSSDLPTTAEPTTAEPHHKNTSHKNTKIEEEQEEAPSARSARGVRSTSTSDNSAREASSGCAATGKTGSSTGKAKASGVPVQRDGEAGKLSREQAAAVRAVEALLPPLLVRELPYGHVPNRNRQAVLETLEGRTVAQLRERIARRWAAYGYEPAIHDGELRSAVGAALELIRPTRCPDPGCEDGELIDTGEDCRACVERKAKRRADRLAGKTPDRPKGKEAAPTCDVCEKPFPGHVPVDLLCTPCRAELDRARQHLTADPAPEGTDLQEQEEAARREAEELEQEAQRRRARRATDAATAAPAVDDVDSAEAQAAAEEDARIRAELLAAHPWMADYAQEPAAPQRPAPY